ncbi:hypothetical protein V2J09_022425 [Rumex salicifolius]
MALSNNVVSTTTLLCILLSTPIIASGIWVSTRPENWCIDLLQGPVIVLGVSVLGVAVAGFVGSFRALPRLLLFYLVAMGLLIALLAALVVFVYVVTVVKGLGHSEPGRAYLEYRLDDFSGWLRRRVRPDYKWARVKRCLASGSVCDGLNRSYTNATEFFAAHLTPLQSGCCKPPTECGYTFTTPTNWISPINADADPDCHSWSNDPSRLCFACDSCKAGFLQSLRTQWRTLNVVLVVTLAALAVVYLVGCYAIRASKTENLFRRYKQGYT